MKYQTFSGKSALFHLVISWLCYQKSSSRNFVACPDLFSLMPFSLREKKCPFRLVYHNHLKLPYYIGHFSKSDFNSVVQIKKTREEVQSGKPDRGWGGEKIKEIYLLTSFEFLLRTFILNW